MTNAPLPALDLVEFVLHSRRPWVTANAVTHVSPQQSGGQTSKLVRTRGESGGRALEARALQTKSERAAHSIARDERAHLCPCELSALARHMPVRGSWFIIY
jgi:hypothetical protein